MQKQNVLLINENGLETLDSFRRNNRPTYIQGGAIARIECLPRPNPVNTGMFEKDGYKFTLTIFKIVNSYRMSKAVLECNFFNHPQDGLVMDCFITGNQDLAKQVKFWQYFYNHGVNEFGNEITTSPVVFQLSENTDDVFEVILLDQSIYEPIEFTNTGSIGYMVNNRLDGRDFSMKIFSDVEESPTNIESLLVHYGGI